MVEQKISDAIKISGVISIFLVICIHYNTQNVAVNPIDLFIQKVLQDGIGRAAVPLFAFFFGFFYFKDSNSIKLFYLHSLKKRFHSIFIPYIIASFIFYIFYTLKEFHGDVQAIPTVKSIFYDILIYPKSSQLWFVRDLMVLSLLSPLFSVNSNVINYILGLVLFILWFFQVQFTPIIGWYILSI